jgi:predicted tellurium resistance membrane protein TerC
MEIWTILRENDWGSYPLMVAGLLVAVRAIRGMVRAFRRSADDWGYITNFRGMILGFAIFGLGLSWLTWHVAVLAITLGIAFEELLETGGMIRTLRQQRRQRGLPV